MAGSPTRVLDVGCGTGKVARTLARRGPAVLGVEADERMANVARGHGVEVEVAPFETWDDAGRRFDLLTCGDAWHWIDPDAGVAKAARVLAAGGVMAWFWNSSQVEEPLASAFTRVYAQHAPEIVWVWGPRDTTRGRAARGTAAGGARHDRVPGRSGTHSARNHRPDLPTAASVNAETPAPSACGNCWTVSHASAAAPLNRPPLS
jgi:SAM-dependent methyltransferase